MAVGAKPPQKLSLTALAPAQQHGCGGLQPISLLSGLQPTPKDQQRIQKLQLKVLLSRDVPKPQHRPEELLPVPAWAREPRERALGCSGWQGQPPQTPSFLPPELSRAALCSRQRCHSPAQEGERQLQLQHCRRRTWPLPAPLPSPAGPGAAWPRTRAGVSRTDSLRPMLSLCCQPHGPRLTRTPGTAQPTHLVPNTQDRASTKVGSGSSFPALPSQFQKPRRESEHKTR